MKTFEELKNKMTLKPRAGDECELGTMYFEPDATRDKMIIIRHLDNKLTVELLPVYVHLYHSIQQWISNNPEVNQYVFMPNLLEVGKDYFIRQYHVYGTSIRRYINHKEPIEPPDEFEDMVRVVSRELQAVPEKEKIIARILRRSLLEPTSKTFFTSRYMKKFVIVEPKVTIADIEQWKQEHFSN
jgi:hypothetical protein